MQIFIVFNSQDYFVCLYGNTSDLTLREGEMDEWRERSLKIVFNGWGGDVGRGGTVFSGSE